MIFLIHVEMSEIFQLENKLEYLAQSLIIE